MRAERAEKMRRLPPAEQITEAIFRGEVHIDDVDESRPDIIAIQDAAAMELQPPIDDREPDRLGRGDFAIILLRKIFERELAALEAGDRLTDWQWPYDLRVQLDVVETAGKR